MPENVLYAIDLILLVPVLWLTAWLFIGAVMRKMVTLRIGWPYCWLGLLAIGGIVARLTGLLA